MKGHIRRRGKNAWAVKIDHGTDPVTGKRRTKWHSVKGERGKPPTRADAVRLRTKLLYELQEGSYVEPAKLTVAELLDKWLADAANAVRPKTHERYAEIVATHLKPALGQHALARLQPIHIQEAWSQAQAAGRRDGKGGLSAQTVKHHHRVLSQALKWAVRLRLLAQNPVEHVDAPRPRRREMQILSPAEVAQVLAAVDGTWLHMPILLAVTTGMRRGEILGLRWRDVDLDAGALSVRQMLEQTRGDAAGDDGRRPSVLRFQEPKTARSRRRLDLPAMTVDALRGHKARQAERLLALGHRQTGDDLVIARQDGEPLHPDTLTKEFAGVVAGLDVPRVRFHDLRHTHLSHLLLNGVHPKVASERAGHASVTITLDTYSHVLPGMQADAAKSIDALLRTAIEQNS